LYSLSWRASRPGIAGEAGRTSACSVTGFHRHRRPVVAGRKAARTLPGRLPFWRCSRHPGRRLPTFVSRHGLRSWLSRRIRTVSLPTRGTNLRLTASSATRRTVQRARPSGGLLHTIAIKRCFWLLSRTSAAPGRCLSYSARSNPPCCTTANITYGLAVSGTTLAICGALAPFANCSKATARRTTRTCWTPPFNRSVSSFWSFGAMRMLRGGRPIPRVCAKTILHKNGFCQFFKWSET